MKIFRLAGAALALLAVFPVRAADDPAIERMAMCQDSWVDWTKTDAKAFGVFRDHVMGVFARKDNEPYWLPKPKVNVSVLGLRVVQLFPDSVGMGVGFSLTVDAPYEKARAAIEKAAGKKLVHCEASDGMKSCELEVAAQRTITVMADDSPKTSQTLIGCYYFYEK
ncbi:MAG TPA: hypothetical protein VMF58_02115 [Rhizomicrobium sp.]|nr:hypothetical protein [Rhizomicrobium sp.]